MPFTTDRGDGSLFLLYLFFSRCQFLSRNFSAFGIMAAGTAVASVLLWVLPLFTAVSCLHHLNMTVHPPPPCSSPIRVKMLTCLSAMIITYSAGVCIPLRLVTFCLGSLMDGAASVSCSKQDAEFHSDRRISCCPEVSQYADDTVRPN